jgi:hypothetical protein
VIKHVIDITDFMTKAMGTPSKFAQALRNTVIPVVSRLAPFQHAFVQTLSELGVAYGGSPIVEGAGKRYFDESMRGGNGILSRFLFLCGSDAASEITESAKELATFFPHLVEYRATPGQGLTFVRPDGYIAYSAPTSEGSAALQSVRSLLERQAN